MDAERWQKIQTIFERALEYDSASRKVFLEQACAGDPTVRKEIEELLNNDEAVQRQAFLSPLDIKLKSPIPTASSDDSLRGQTLGHYRIQKRLGGGGVGEVFLAVRTSDYQQLVAIKVLKQGMDTKCTHRADDHYKRNCTTHFSCCFHFTRDTEERTNAQEVCQNKVVDEACIYKYEPQ